MQVSRCAPRVRAERRRRDPDGPVSVRARREDGGVGGSRSEEKAREESDEAEEGKGRARPEGREEERQEGREGEARSRSEEVLEGEAEEGPPPVGSLRTVDSRLGEGGACPAFIFPASSRRPRGPPLP